MSHGYCPYTTVASLKAADKMLGANRVWSAIDKVQAGWLDRYYRPIAPKLAAMPEIVANATNIPVEHVAFLKRHGWEARITQCPPRQFLSAGMLDLLVKWKEAGTAVPLKAMDGKTYPGAMLKHGVKYWQTDAATAACIDTKTGDRVWLMMMDSAPNQLELADAAQALITGKKRPTRQSALHFPMVDLASREKLDWLKGVYTLGNDGRQWDLHESVQQITLKMNHLGAHARAVDEMRFGPTSIEVPFTIDRPFLVAFERPGEPQPIFTAYVTQDCWKDPGKL